MFLMGVCKHAHIWSQTSGRSSTRKQGSQAPSSSQAQSSSQAKSASQAPSSSQPLASSLSPHQHISLTLWPHPTKQQGHSHQLKLHGHNNQVSGTFQTLDTQLEELLGSLQANQHHTPLQKHGTLEHHYHRYCSFMFYVLFIKL